MKIIRFLLFPISILYNAITAIRNLFFDIGIFKQTSFELPIIAVGNLSVGGTGKTPQIEYLIRLLKNKQVATLSRGYKRKTKGFLLIGKQHIVEEVGDEPMQFYKKFKDILVAVDADRTNGIKQLLVTKKRPEVILLDDAFQHRKVKAGFYILLTKYNDLFADDFVLPTGNLRESRSGAKRADIIVVTKCPENLSEKEQEKLRNKIPLIKNQQLFFSCINYSEYLIGKEQQIKLQDLKEKELLVVTGIASPQSLLEFLSTQKITYKHLSYPDHHHFTESDIKIIEKELKVLETNEKMIVTTEKDYVRLEGRLDNLFYLPIESKFLTHKEQFDKRILNYVQKQGC